MWDTLTGALGAVGSALDTPRRLVYQGLSGITGRDWKGFGDVLGEVGVDKDSIPGMVGGFLGDVATDPLTWAGMGAGRYLRGLGAADDVGRAAGMGGNTGAFRQGLKDTTYVTDVVPTKGMETGLSQGVSNTGRPTFSAALDANSGVTGTVRRAGPRVGEAGTEDAGLTTLASLLEHGERGVLPEGSYLSQPRMIWQSAGAPVNTGRHERVHAIIDSAVRNPQEAGELPFLMRSAARMRAAPEGGITESLGRVTDELAAHSLENRSLGKQLQGAGHFLFNPAENAYYSGLYGDATKSGRFSPLVARLYGSLPHAPERVGAGTSALSRMLSGGS